MTLDRNKQPPDAEALLAHGGWVRKLAQTLASGSELADDTEQDAWRNALEHPPAHGSNLKAWWSRVVRTASYQRSRSEKRHQKRIQVLADRSEPLAEGGPEHIAERLEFFEFLTRMVRELPEPYGSTVVLHFFDGMSLGSIAKQNGIPKSTVNTHLRRGVAMLRTRLRRSHGEGWRTQCLALAIPTPSISFTGSVLTTLLMKAQSKALLLVAIAASAGTLAIWQPWAPDKEFGGMESQLAEPVAALAQNKPESDGEEPGERILVPIAPTPSAIDQENARFLLPAGKKRDAWIEIEVLDSEGEPWPDLPFDFSARPGYAVPARWFATNKMGILRIPCISGEWKFRLISDERRGGNGIDISKNLDLTPGETQRYSVRFPGLATIQGFALDPGGNPLVGVRLQYWGKDRVKSVDWREAGITDEEGSFQFDGIEGRYTIAAYPKGFPVLRVDCEDTLASASRDLVLQYPPCRTVSLQVLDGNGEAIEAATLEYSQGNDSSRISRSNGRTFSFSRHEVGLTDQDGMIQVSARVDTPWELSLSHASIRHLSITIPAMVEEYTFQVPLPSGVSFHGRVLGPTQNPIVGARVRAWAYDPSKYEDGDPSKWSNSRPEVSRPWKESVSDENGAVTIHHLPESAQGYLLVEAEGMAYTSLEGVSFPGSHDGLNIQMERALPISGRLLDREDIPVPGRVVEVQGHPAFGRQETWMNLPYYFNTYSVRTNADGDFSFPGLKPGIWTINVHRIGGFSPAALVEVTSGIQDLIIHLGDGLSDLINISGTVVDAVTRKPLSEFHGVLAWLKTQDGVPTGAVSSTDFQSPQGENRFLFSGLEVTSSALQIDAPGYSQWTELIPAIAGEYKFEVALIPAVAPKIRILDSSANSVVGIRVTAFIGDDREIVFHKNSAGIMRELGFPWPPTINVTDQGGMVSLVGIPMETSGYFRIGGEEGRPSLDVPFMLESGDGKETLVLTLPDDFLQEWKGSSDGG